MDLRSITMTAALALGAVAGSACGANENSQAPATNASVVTSQPVASAPAAGKETIVVTFSALGSVVEDLVGDVVDVEVLIPNGMDPHDFEPSARDVEKLTKATLVVANGLDLEEGLEDAIAEVQKSGTPVFFVTDHVTLRSADDEHDEHDEENEHGEEEHGEEKDGVEDDGDHGHDHGSDDPHVWLDPVTVAEAVPALAAEVGALVGVDLSAEVDRVVEGLGALSGEIAREIDTLESCVLLTGHDSLGYFAARYGCEVVGSIVPGFSTAAEATAGELAELKKVAQAEGVKAVFTEQGTPKSVADQMAKELGVEVVELPHHRVPESGGYGAMMRELAASIVDGLA